MRAAAEKDLGIAAACLLFATTGTDPDLVEDDDDRARMLTGGVLLFERLDTLRHEIVNLRKALTGEK